MYIPAVPPKVQPRWVLMSRRTLALGLVVLSAPVLLAALLASGDFINNIFYQGGGSNTGTNHADRAIAPPSHAKVNLIGDQGE